jgi:hypothetical protein
MNEREARMRSRTGAAMFSVVLLAACSSTQGAGNTPPSPSTPSSVSTEVRILDDCPELPCGGLLEPGAYRWTYSEPTIGFDITSQGWSWLFGGGGLHLIADQDPLSTSEGLYVPDGIYLFSDPTIASRNCEEASEPGVGRSVNDLVGWLEAAPGLTVSEPIPVTVGGLEGMELDIVIDRTWKRTCVFSEKLPAVPLIFNGAEPGGYHWAILPDQSLRWFVLGSEDGTIIVSIEDDPGGLPHDELLERAGEIVDSFVFDPHDADA